VKLPSGSFIICLTKVGADTVNVWHLEPEGIEVADVEFTILIAKKEAKVNASEVNLERYLDKFFLFKEWWFCWLKF
jgi:hypothetical protein